MAKHRLYEESVDSAVYATGRGLFISYPRRVVGKVDRRIAIGDYWSASDEGGPLALWEVELVESVAAARRARGL